MKANYEVYQVNSDVYGVSTYMSKEGPTNHFAIFPARVSYVTVSHNEKTNKTDIDYLLMTPDGQDWGDSVDADMVSDSFEELTLRLKVIWDAHANTF